MVILTNEGDNQSSDEI